MGMPISELVCAVLSSATVVDVDFSEWYKHVRLVVESEYTDEPTYAQDQCWIVTFVHVRCIEFRFAHYHISLLKSTGKWRMYFSECVIEGSPPHLVLRADTPPDRELVVECESISVAPFPRHIIYQLFPDWHRAVDTGLARPGLEGLWHRWCASK